jgi:hypothetical protein
MQNPSVGATGWEHSETDSADSLLYVQVCPDLRSG